MLTERKPRFHGFGCRQNGGVTADTAFFYSEFIVNRCHLTIPAIGSGQIGCRPESRIELKPGLDRLGVLRRGLPPDGIVIEVGATRRFHSTGSYENCPPRRATGRRLPGHFSYRPLRSAGEGATQCKEFSPCDCPTRYQENARFPRYRSISNQNSLQVGESLRSLR
jgi:hypothetical protein